MTYRLIALDLDDTLLGPDGQIPPAHREALDAARARGCEITLVTARGWPATGRFVAQLRLTLPVVCLTGAVIHAPSGAPVWSRPMAMAEARALLARSDAEGWATRLYFADGRIHQSCVADDFVPWRGGRGYKPPADGYAGALTPYLDGGESPVQLAMLGPRSAAGALALLPDLPETAASAYDPGTPSARVHLLHRAVSKGAGLETLCRTLAIPREAVIAMGDGEADRSMIEWAGTGVAMGWAPEEVRRAADVLTAPDDPHPVATALQRLLGL